MMLKPGGSLLLYACTSLPLPLLLLFPASSSPSNVADQWGAARGSAGDKLSGVRVSMKLRADTDGECMGGDVMG